STSTGVNEGHLMVIIAWTVLSCSNVSPINLISILWKIRLRDGARCSLAYRADLNQTDRTNCSEQMNWASRPDHDLALQIYPLRPTYEGNYMCEIVNNDGTFHRNYALLLYVLHEVTLTLDLSGTPLCKVFAGKSAAQISWVNTTSKNKSTCFVSHLTGNESQSIEFPSGEYCSYTSFSLLVCSSVNFSVLKVRHVPSLFIVGNT
uniref:Ig-like domain-containing protein n=1 Tax=Pelusios castaneus TaxID=367368 RepID=A0A8C8RBY8_9SAUR